MKILLLTVGGSCEPLIESILKNRPDKIYFICSGGDKSSRRTIIGEGHVCGRDSKNLDKPNVLRQVNIDPSKKEKFEIIEIEEFDDPNSCYEKCVGLINSIKREYPSVEVIADYTGGTKSMTAGLVMAAMDDPKITLCVITGERNDLISVASGTQQKRLIGLKLPLLERQFRAAIALADRYDYNGCLQVLENLLDIPDIPSGIREKILRAISLARGFREWDLFNHKEALRILESFAGDITDNFLFLKRVIGSRTLLDKPCERFCKDHSLSVDFSGYELVEDLLLNAKRKACQGLYDDATGRVYRALEALVDIRLLLQYGKDKNESQLGLKDGFEFLVELNGYDELAVEYVKRRGKIEGSLSIRNKSIFAHGYTPIYEREFVHFLTTVEDLYRLFMTKISQNLLEPVQFPQFSCLLVV